MYWLTCDLNSNRASPNNNKTRTSSEIRHTQQWHLLSWSLMILQCSRNRFLSYLQFNSIHFLFRFTLLFQHYFSFLIILLYITVANFFYSPFSLIWLKPVTRKDLVTISCHYHFLYGLFNTQHFCSKTCVCVCCCLTSTHVIKFIQLCHFFK